MADERGESPAREAASLAWDAGLSRESPPVLAIGSRVALGRVGNRAACFALELLGFETWEIDTVLFSNHPGRGSHRGEIRSPEAIRETWAGLRELGVAGSCRALLSGYLGAASNAEPVLEALRDLRAANPGLVFCCDPVIGYSGAGMYVGTGVPEAIRDLLLPAADIATPNLFEAGILAGRHPDLAIPEGRRARISLVESLHGAGPRVLLVTSWKPEAGAGGGTGVLLSAGDELWEIMTPELAFPREPKGTGDLLGALFLGRWLGTGGDGPAALELAVNALYAVLELSLAVGGAELSLVAAREAVARPPLRYRAVRR